MEQTFDHVPAGRYSLTFQADIGGFRYPARGQPALEVTISTVPTIIEVPLLDLIWIDLDAVVETGADYSGPLDLMVWRWAGPPGGGGGRAVTGMFPCSFDRPPYSIPVAEAGSYGLKITWPERDPTLHPKSGDTVEIAPGRSVRHVVSLRP